MMNEKIEKALNEQINKETYSAFLYLAMAQWFESVNLRGFAHWMTVQYGEEMGHAMKMVKYVNERNGRVTIHPVKGPKNEWSSPLEAIEETSRHEQSITQSIGEIANLAVQEKDHATQSFLTWFVNEQVEEESNAREILDNLKMLGESKQGVFMIDRHLANRKKD